MKKLQIAFLLFGSIVAFGGDLEDKIEMNLMKSYPTITDGTTSLPIKDYDVDIKKDILKVEIEVRETDSSNIFDKMNKAELEKILSQIADVVKKEASSTNNVNLKIEFEHDVLPDKTLYKNTF